MSYLFPACFATIFIKGNGLMTSCLLPAMTSLQVKERLCSCEANSLISESTSFWKDCNNESGRVYLIKNDFRINYVCT